MSFNKNKESSLDDKTEELVASITKGSKKLRDETHRDTKESIKYDDVDFGSLDNNTKKTYTDLFTGMIDIYKLVGATKDDSDEVIKKKCINKITYYHPDKQKRLLEKVPLEMRESEKKKLDAQYKLVKDAYNILKNPEKRKYYDLQKKTTDSKNFIKQKESFDNFIKLQESEINDNTKQLAKNNYNMGTLDFDKKHGFKRSELDDKPLDSAESAKRLQDLEWERTQQEIESVPKNLFKGKQPTLTEFNTVWEKMNNNKKTKNISNDGSLVKWDGISASNDMGLSGGSNYISINSNYEDLYDTNNFNSSEFASRLDSDDELTYNSDNDNDDNNIDASYVTEHNKNKKDVMSKFTELENRRKDEDNLYEERRFGDNKVWGSVLDNPMNISYQLGNIVGKDMKALTGPKKKTQITKDEIEAYKQLVYENDISNIS
jgi:curved DNA-binding protein CbpA